MGFFAKVHKSVGPVADYATAHRPVAAALRSAGYCGWVSVEMRSAPGWRTAVREAGRAMREAWF